MGTPTERTIGARLRGIRVAQHLTLKELGERVGCSGALISQIENGHTSPSISTLVKIADSLGVSPVDFFEEDEDVASVVIMDSKERKPVRIKNWEADVHQLIKSTRGRLMQPFHTIIPPGGGSGENYSHPGQEFGYIIRGRLTLKVETKTYELTTGKSFYYSSLFGHEWKNDSDEDVEVIWVVSPPNL